MALAGIGVDIVEIPRMARALERTPSMRTRLFTKEERDYCDSSARPAEHYAARFAAREAVLKALGTGFSQGIGYADVSVVRDAAGRPKCVLAGRAREIAEKQGIQEVALSLSFTRELAVANAVAVTEAVRPKKEETPDPQRDLAESFRKARSVLDELDAVEAQGAANSGEETKVQDR